MGNISILDCTLRDGGYVNDFVFGEKVIRGFLSKIVETGIEYCEVGFIKANAKDDPDINVYPGTEAINRIIQPKDANMKYVGMVDMSSPVPLDMITPYDGTGIDVIRVIFKKSKIKEGYHYCDEIMKKGYTVFAQFVGTDAYSDKEFIEAIELFNELEPYGVSIVDSFGLITRKQFLRLVYLADNNLKPGITLGYHAHNNLQQAMGNSEALLDLNLARNIVIDACVFGMGRGAGNLNLELFAEYMNEVYGTDYKIEPMLEIMDEYLEGVYKDKFWGYSLPMYLSASNGCHPNYSIYLQNKHALTVKSFSEILKNIPDDKKAQFSKENAEYFYEKYLDNHIDDSAAVASLKSALDGKEVLVLAPGSSLRKNADDVKKFISEKNPVIIAVNFDTKDYPIDYIFSSNMKRFAGIQSETDAKCIITSNMREAVNYEYMVNFASYKGGNSDIIDNAGVMILRLLASLGLSKVSIAGMDGYSAQDSINYFDKKLEYDFQSLESRNALIAKEIEEVSKTMACDFITPTVY